ncbi:hypothetical protein A5658_25865 [Mycobacterium sp. 1245111.1]|uniref:PPE family protein, SVP subgroup n=1 Tax=Mycobacterium sp. 1245111.1 TaxID=1834073 RepID=UPI0007FDD4A0|nr:PPE domain-containing protein [Mycobacterium sp. 1245111.1]OBK38783.1 hypothetical protein A5658_25865 [Mycobacterium sp. 1245111.1]
MYFGSLPPEINSANMYSGAGSAPLLAAAAAWDGLAGELTAVANSYQAAVTELTSGPWLGPASVSMSAAAAPYVAWLQATAAQAEETSARAKSAAAAYQTAFSATVPPAMVAANRAQLTTLLATNVFGRNAAAIAATEAQYGQMWAQDLAAMYGYAASSAAATALTPFSPAPQTTNPGGAISTATGPATGMAQGTVQRALSAVPGALASAAAAAPAATDPADALNTLADFLTIFLNVPSSAATFLIGVPANVLGVTGFPVSIVGAGTGIHTDDIISGWEGEEPYPSTAPAPIKPFPAPLLNLPEGTLFEPSVEAGVGEANTVGALSVPPTWAVATPAVRPIAFTLPGTASAAEVPAAADADSSSTLSEMALAGMAGRVMSGAVAAGAGQAARGARAATRTALQAIGADRAPAHEMEAMPPETLRAVVTGVATELREFAKLRDEGLITDDEYAEQKNRLLGR